ncbi:predicted protein [Botrytis cinerea T4]|uniref:Uncharacterized protein n=1 Tax=Botryotinia fuckeliana (strain T4) TaxID=999810 RepID=G2Y9I6_BOTF4|nr:predicted protein [Botrytis cinerea T4]
MAFTSAFRVVDSEQSRSSPAYRNKNWTGTVMTFAGCPSVTVEHILAESL